MSIGLLLPPRGAAELSRVLREVRRLLAAFGATVDLIFPDDEPIEPARVRVEHDLYVLKSKSPSALRYARALHERGAKTINPYPVTALCRDKAVTAQALAAAGVPVPETIVEPDPARLIPRLHAGPLIVKPTHGSRGRGVQVVRTEQDIRRMAASAEAEPIMAQRYHEPDGRDRKMYRIGDDFFCVKRVWPPSTYADKLGAAVPVDDELQELTAKCGSALGIDLYGVDVVISGGRPYVVDLSSFPGFKGVPDAPVRLAEYLYAAAR